MLRFKIKKGGLEAISISSLSHRIHAKRASPVFPLRFSLADWTVPGRVRRDRMRTLPAVEGLRETLSILSNRKTLRDYLKSTQVDSEETEIELQKETLEE